LRGQSSPEVDVLTHMKCALRAGHLVLCLLWIVDYLSQLDSQAIQLSYYQQCVSLLAFVYWSVVVVVAVVVQVVVVLRVVSIIG